MVHSRQHQPLQVLSPAVGVVRCARLGAVELDLLEATNGVPIPWTVYYPRISGLPALHGRWRE